MSFKDVLPPHQPQYYVDGYPPVTAAAGLTSVSSSDKSLQLKPDKDVRAQQPQMPSRTDGSEQESLRQHLREAEARALERQHQIANQAETRGPTRDALDEAIEQARAVKDLVS